jgi:hypothetical protein
MGTTVQTLWLWHFWTAGRSSSHPAGARPVQRFQRARSLFAEERSGGGHEEAAPSAPLRLRPLQAAAAQANNLGVRSLLRPGRRGRCVVPCPSSPSSALATASLGAFRCQLPRGVARAGLGPKGTRPARAAACCCCPATACTSWSWWCTATLPLVLVV